MTAKIKTGLVGYGRIGESIHAPLIDHEPLLELTAVVERNREKSREKYPDITIYRSLDEMLIQSEIQMVIICTPNAEHFPQAKAALEAGKHVVVEKPITVTSKEAEILDKLAKSKGLVLSVFQNRRWDGDFLTVKQLLEEKVLGRILHFESHFDRFRPKPKTNWREKKVPGSGILYDLGPHLIDQAIQLFGMPSWIYAEILLQRSGVEADDFFELTMMYGNLKVRLTASIMLNAPLPKFLILGEKGSYSKYGLDIQEAAFKAGIQPGTHDWGREAEEDWGKIFLENESYTYPTLPGDYTRYYKNIAKAINGEEELKVKPEEAILSMKIIEAAQKSNQEGRRVFSSEFLDQ
ncbi:oxidoreductase [Echinicola jeungdonensis]|uniref:Oxidoreductase n=1 Tax=Echinicola jeungdonensis TaxID=709343 RepID=A0ABV5J254_9BACT|nr:oxidoreductase [Echinicola jeungdonensis]MDN3668965.1 oxidoreductase [Echinicola jeungdonensis]